MNKVLQNPPTVTVDDVLGLPQKIFERSSSKAFLRLTKAVVLLVAAYFVLALLPWYLVPIGWLFTGTTFAGLLAVGYACGTDSFFNNTVVNHIVGQLCLLPLMIPFESWHEQYTSKKESLKVKIQQYLSLSHFWWCSSFWQSVSSHLEALFSLKSKRVLGNLLILYLFAGIFFPVMTYNAGLWGLFKYYFIPLMVYHFWASSYLKTSAIIELLDNDDSDFVTLAYYKYPKWVEFLSLELNYAMGSLRQFKGRLLEFATSDKAESENVKGEPLKPKKESDVIPFYNLKEALRILKEESSEKAKKISVRLQELSFFSLLRSRKGGLLNDTAKFKDVIAEELSKINWVTAIFLTITPILAIYGLVVCEYNWKTWTLMLLHYFTGGLGITAGYHRLFSHRAFSAGPLVRYALLIFGTSTFQMSCLDWCDDHRAHHRYTDTDKDPYSIRKGFWYAHIGWLLFNRPCPGSDIKDLERDPVIRFQHQYYGPLALFFGLGMPTLIAGFGWGDWLGGFLIAGVLRTVFVHHATFCVNSVAHYYGSFTYTDARTPRDSWLVGLITFGEGYHNFHHEFPYDYRNGAAYHAYDPTKWLIWLLSWTGLTYDLKKFDEETIEKGKIEMQEKILRLRRERLHWGPPEETLPSYSMEKVKQDCAAGEKLIVIGGFVHDVRAFIDEHPAGSAIVKPYIGKDASNAFNGLVYNHSNAARNILRTLRVAKLEAKDHQE